MFVTNHVLAGAALGAVTRRPALAFVVGAASHLLLDAVPHWGATGRTVFLAAAVVDGLLGLTVLGLVTRAAPPRLRAAVLAGMLGAAAPDLDKPAELFLGAQPFPDAFQALHGAVQQEAAGRWWVEAVTLVLAAVAVVTLLQRARHRQEPGGAAPPGRGGGTTHGPAGASPRPPAG